ncbi:hypothetical protein LX36DRAFT_660983 [Colletotrichum falcatum]|nr:hypothetical protein LX36DRAFT_660983 [Colletotrichum falcatum]
MALICVSPISLTKHRTPPPTPSDPRVAADMLQYLSFENIVVIIRCSSTPFPSSQFVPTPTPTSSRKSK